MYSQFQKNINNLFNAYVLMQRPEDQRLLQQQHEKAQKLAQINTQINTVTTEMNQYPQRLHEQDACDNRVQTSINECARDNEMLRQQLNTENDKYEQQYKQIQK